MIKAVEIENFRSIKELYFEPQNLCAIIGPNSSGKSNVLKAIDLVLGEGWVTKAKVARELFHDATKPLKIKIDFTQPVRWYYYSSLKQIRTINLVMTVEPEYQSIVRLWENYPNDKNGDGYYLNDEFKKACHFIYIPSNRELADQMRVSQWTILGKMMRTIYENYVGHYESEENLKKAFENAIGPAQEFLEYDFSPKTGTVSFNNFYTVFQRYCTQNSVGLATQFEAWLNIYNVNWFYKTLQISVKEANLEKMFDADEVGSGMQNLILLSLFQTYAELSKGRAIFAIEEPEIYLYPQAQRELYNNFKDLSRQSQIFYTTHNPNFIDATRAHEIEILRKDPQSGTVTTSKNLTYLTEDSLNAERFRIFTHFNSERNELFFARFIILVEGASDKILWTTLLQDKWGININKKGISIIECGGKGGVVYFIGVLRLLGITSFAALWDKDDDVTDNFGHLTYALQNQIGLELDPNLEEYLKLRFPEFVFSSDSAKKVKNAFEWASKIDVHRIPAEFEFVKNAVQNSI